MERSLIKVELTSLMVVCLLALTAFYFQGNLPDNYLVISSSNESGFLFTYWVSSVIAFFGYYIGPWIMFPTLAFVFLNYFLLRKREFLLDAFFIAPLLIGFLFASYLFFPEIVGEGARFLIDSQFSELAQYLVLAVAIIIIGFFIFKDFFKQGFFKSLEMLYEILMSGFERIKNGFVGLFSRVFSYRPNFNLRKKVTDKMVKVSEPEPTQTFQESSFEEVEVDGRQMTIPNIVEEKSDIAVGIKKKIVSPKRVSSKFSQVELIQCISIDEKEKVINNPDKKYFNEIIENIENKLAEFKIDAKIIHILKGPVVDTFELELGEGVKVSKVTSLTQDLSLALSGAPIRMIYPMEGKTTIGIEVPRDPRDVIYLDECLESKEFNDAKNKLALAMGKDSFGQPFVADLTKMPHLLVAGATGAGKSVFINTLLVSLLIKMSPEKLKLILIDPKQLELALYQNIPHLILPVITDPERASLSLMWAVQEMERRYTILSKMGVRSIDSYNQKVKSAAPGSLEKIQDLFEVDDFELPYLVIVIDEFADLILTKNGKVIETNINRLAAKARACGIHLIIATQRPSVDVITGLIKANFPSRVSFRVTASQDSRTILNMMGAEKLLGKGDMLYKIGVEMRRLHSAFVDEEEIAILMDKICDDDPVFSENAMEFIENEGNALMGEELVGGGGNRTATGTSSDPLYKEAVKIVIENRSASASMLQRRLSVGYNRAANLVETMESNGVVGPAQGSKPRQVLVNSID